MENSKSSYFDLSEHNSTQIIIFFVSLVFFVCLIFYTFLPFIQSIIVNYLGGSVFNDGSITYVLRDSKKEVCRSHFLFKWAMDIGKPEATRYWLNPLLSLIIPSSLLSLIITIFITTVLPRKISLMGQKIDREIVYFLDKINYKSKGVRSEADNKDLKDIVLSSDLRQLHDYREKWGIYYEDLKSLQKALKWREAGFLKGFWYASAGISLYMRFYFTEKYNNTVMGMVYIGAAVLIIIIGMRGLKFIPPTEPSLVFFALGLEFSLLITYAFTLMYSKQDTESNYETKYSGNENINLSNEFGSSKEVENLLKVFIKSTKK